MLFNAESKLIHAAKYVIPLTIAITGLLKYVINRIIIVKKTSEPIGPTILTYF